MDLPVFLIGHPPRNDGRAVAMEETPRVLTSSSSSESGIENEAEAEESGIEDEGRRTRRKEEGIKGPVRNPKLEIRNKGNSKKETEVWLLSWFTLETAVQAHELRNQNQLLPTAQSPASEAPPQTDAGLA